MKTKNILLVFMLLSVTISYAQLKLRTNGSIWAGYTGYPNIYMGTCPYRGYDNGRWGIEVWDDNLNFWKPWPSPNNGSNYYMFLTTSGAIGIGKVPTHSEICLDVEGIVYSYGNVLTSDERLKTNIKPLTVEPGKLYQLNGKSYKKHAVEDELVLPDIKDDKGNVIRKYQKSTNKKGKEISEFGFLAQELMTVYPELVSQDTLGYYYVNYIGLIPLLVEAVKEQKTEIDALTTIVNKLSAGSNLKKVAAISTNTIETDAVTYPVLDQNIPNPFNAATSISFYLPNTVNAATIYVYDMNGVQLKSYSIPQRGKSNIMIQGSELNAGMYLYALIADGKVIDTKRMILTK